MKIKICFTMDTKLDFVSNPSMAQLAAAAATEAAAQAICQATGKNGRPCVQHVSDSVMESLYLPAEMCVFLAEDAE